MASATYSFASRPQPVAGNRKKYREPGEDLAPFRDLKQTCITFDKRVHRGNTYGQHVQSAMREALQQAAALEGQTLMPAKKMRRKPAGPKEPKIFDQPLPEPDRPAIDLTKHLIAPDEKAVIKVETADTQTDEFLPEEPPEAYVPQKTGIDACTQVENNDLFKFDDEVEPILDVIVGKTLEQALMEVDEEYELEAMKDFKEEFYEHQARMMQEWQVQVDEERARCRAKDALMQRRREEKAREASVLRKIRAVNAANEHFAGMVPRVIHTIQESAFPDMHSTAIASDFLPQLLQQVSAEVGAQTRALQHVEELATPQVARHIAAQASGLAVHVQRRREHERRRFERKQQRRGLVHFFVDRGKGMRESIGPIQLCPNDSLEANEARVAEWLKVNEPKLAEATPHGVLLTITGTPVASTAKLLESEVGLASLVPREPPPPPPPPPPVDVGDAQEGSPD
mmetsp:Transcript_114443/g.227740  ORF Transcript_114443/g.227740 Transcript_114443/m.227740 type:complete len:455 (-) Transcript_114443:172-1536(-)|eukprot:CAMPEP_0172676094 /NCGR_PEP_ID=MMETSP1074-20121228/13716_1 /TAXON_ID=2916 /ORGANISM="Ceratium fusus, Strain PA161109" /LENGTH=454 /DNA_ID=CAMNT_0013493665 /DNA_START=147 /DNA_END=1511 /DNA_ORIENTATION=+